jgi:limonene-1,2-epoxide hydrolase
MSKNADLVRSFVDAWARCDPAELAGYFADDGIYHNIPVAPVKGKSQIEAAIRGFTASWSDVKFELLNLIEQGSLVIAERLDRARVGGKPMALPCVGVFELEAGKIKVWRDYFDLATYTRAVS